MLSFRYVACYSNEHNVHKHKDVHNSDLLFPLIACFKWKRLSVSDIVHYTIVPRNHKKLFLVLKSKQLEQDIGEERSELRSHLFMYNYLKFW